MRPTSGMYHSRPTDLVISCVAVGLENAFERSQEPLRPVASATQAEIEHHAPSRATVLPEVRLVVLTSVLACLHIDWGFIRLNVTSADQFSPHCRDHRDQQLADFEDPAVERRAARVDEPSWQSFDLAANEARYEELSSESGGS